PTRAGADEDVEAAVGVDVAGADKNAAPVGRRKSQEGAQQCRVSDLTVALDLVELRAIDDPHLRPARGHAGDDVGAAIAVDVAGGHGDAARESRPVRLKGPEPAAGDLQLAADEDLY